MKKVKRRTVFTLFLILCFVFGMGVLMYRYVTQGAKWAAFSGNQSVYENGKLVQGAIYDRNGALLYDAKTGTYNEDTAIRTATLHAVGDRQGNIATSALSKFSEEFTGYSAITGTTQGGNDLYLTLDADLCAAAYEAMGDYKGTVAVYNYKTGEILCMVSTPTYDPENVPEISDDDPQYTGVYLNRFYSSTFTPGSVFKVITLAAAIENIPNAMAEETFDCEGEMTIGGAVIHCTGEHGEQTLKEAFANSCNVAFGELAVELGASTMAKYAEEAGLTESHSVNGIRTAAGNYEVQSDKNTLAWSGIGQANDLVSPCAMLRLMGGIANGGIPVEPRILECKKKSDSGEVEKEFSAETGERIWSESTCETIKELMRNNVVEKYGQERFGDLPVCAKSGTAETGRENPTSWFVGFVDDEEHPYAFVAVCEDAGYGSKVAGTVVAQVLSAMS